ncbi:hypothetical protein DXG03_005017 [Asterophora parasitica]|uniref:Transcription factor CBF/NF-Y/archaeal histone domain-containing protein n=1 Tax=Asterophora parasitica TaxID=117018 RepID=A0A9P7GE88_9AGAR|nr:hypothetical protein DXG03_005017 [Asterophora parasitica]
MPMNEEEAHEDETRQLEEDGPLYEEQSAEPDDGDDAGALSTKKKRAYVRKEPVALSRETGKSLLPFSRVQKIIKADKEIPIIAKDATFLISLATEEFIKRLSEAGQRVAERERRTTVQHKDIATVVRKADEFLFLEEIIPWMAPDPAPKRKPPGTAGGLKGAPTMLDQFVASNKRTEDDDLVEYGGDIVMNEDGTMGAGGEEMDDDFE